MSWLASKKVVSKLKGEEHVSYLDSRWSRRFDMAGLL